MSILDWAFIGILTTAILFAFFSSVFFVVHFFTKQKYRKIKQVRSKNKKKHRILKKKAFFLKKKSKQQLKLGIVLLVCALLLGGSASFARYYQATNLGDRDSTAIVEGYYLLEKTSQQLGEVPTVSNIEKARNNLRELAAKLSGFGIRYADPKLTADGQRVLNRYYTQVKELGLNLNNQSIENLQEKSINDQYLADIEKVQKKQKEVFSYFKVNESALQQKK